MGATPPVKAILTGTPQVTQSDGDALVVVGEGKMLDDAVGGKVAGCEDDEAWLPDCKEVWVVTAARDWELDRLLDEEAGGGACDSDANWLTDGATLNDGVEPCDSEGVAAWVDAGEGKLLDDAV